MRQQKLVSTARPLAVRDLPDDWRDGAAGAAGAGRPGGRSARCPPPSTTARWAPPPRAGCAPSTTRRRIVTQPWVGAPGSARTGCWRCSSAPTICRGTSPRSTEWVQRVPARGGDGRRRRRRCSTSTASATRSARVAPARSIPPAPATCSPPPSSCTTSATPIPGTRPRPPPARPRCRWKARAGRRCPTRPTLEAALAAVSRPDLKRCPAPTVLDVPGAPAVRLAARRRSCAGGQVDAQCSERFAALRPVGVARLHPAEPHHRRRAAAAPRRGRAARRDVQSGDLREGHRGLRRLRGPAQGADEAARPRRQGRLRDPGRPRHPGRRRHPEADLHARPGGATATSAWRSRPIWPTTRRARSTRRGACGRRWRARTS